MGHFYTTSNTTVPIGKVMDYNNTNPAGRVALYRLSSNGVLRNPLRGDFSGSFAQAVYGDSSYSLTCPNVRSDVVAQNIDYIA